MFKADSVKKYSYQLGSASANSEHHLLLVIRNHWVRGGRSQTDGTVKLSNWLSTLCPRSLLGILVQLLSFSLL